MTRIDDGDPMPGLAVGAVSIAVGHRCIAERDVGQVRAGQVRAG